MYERAKSKNNHISVNFAFQNINLVGWFMRERKQCKKKYYYHKSASFMSCRQ